MNIILCENCKVRQATEQHHLFSQSKINKKKYGKLIHDKKNIQYLCQICHHNKPVKKYTEKQFCDIMGIEIKSKVFKKEG